MPNWYLEAHIMDMPVFEPVTTVDEFLALPEDGVRQELLAGSHIVMPAPRPDHQRVVLAIARLLQDTIAGREDVEVFGATGDIVLGPDTVVEPDVFLLRSGPGSRFTSWRDAPVPLLAVEVLSPSTAARDRGIKRRLYFEGGVEEYWIVDVDARVVERWRAGDVRPEIVEQKLDWELSVGVGGTIDLAVVFERIL